MVVIKIALVKIVNNKPPRGFIIHCPNYFPPLLLSPPLLLVCTHSTQSYKVVNTKFMAVDDDLLGFTFGFVILKGLKNMVLVFDRGLLIYIYIYIQKNIMIACTPQSAFLARKRDALILPGRGRPDRS